jgi:type II secretory pathway pseudopilin PulG
MFHLSIVLFPHLFFFFFFFFLLLLFLNFIHPFILFSHVCFAVCVFLKVLMVNEFDSVVDGFVAVTSKWARLYFSSFFLLGVLLMLNIVIAVMLDSYLTSMREMERVRALKHEQRMLLRRQNSFRDDSNNPLNDDDNDEEEEDDDTAKKSSFLTNCLSCDKRKLKRSSSSVLSSCSCCCDGLFNSKSKPKPGPNGYIPVRNHDIVEGRDDILEVAEEEEQELEEDGFKMPTMGQRAVSYDDSEEVSPGLKMSAVSRMLNAISVANDLSTSENTAISMQERSTLLTEALLTRNNQRVTPSDVSAQLQKTYSSSSSFSSSTSKTSSAPAKKQQPTSSTTSLPMRGAAPIIVSSEDEFADASSHDDDDEYTSVI